MTIQTPTNKSTVSGAQATAKGPVALQMFLLTTLFFLWGFVTSLNDVLIPHFKALFSLSYTQSSLVQFCFFTAYFVVSLPAGLFMSRYGYKLTLIAGLLIAAVGALLFFPAAQALSYPIFLLGLFTLAAGITFLQVSANTFVSIIGDTKTAASRLNLTQAFNSLGTTIAPKLGGVFILVTAGVVLTREDQAAQLKMPYLIICGILVLLAVLSWVLLAAPKAAGESEHAAQDVGFLETLRHPQVYWGFINLFLYVGAEVCIGSFLISYLAQPSTVGLSAVDAAGYVSFYWGGAMIGRFVGSAILRKFAPLKVLGTFTAIAAILVVAAMGLQGPIAMWTILAVGLFNSIQFPTIFSTSIEGLGRLTEKASSFLIMAIFGGAVLPVAFGAIADNISLRVAFIIPLICYAIISAHSFYSAARRPGA